MDFVHPVEAVLPGVQGRILAVLVETTAELSVRSIARLAGVSPAQASRVLPDLVELGLIERREVPPSSQFRLVRSNVAARALIDLARSRESVLDLIGVAAAQLAVAPLSIIVFGSFARRDAGPDSDLDVVIVRPDGVDEDDDAWSDSVEDWRAQARAIAGNPVEILETGRAEAAGKLRGRSALWRDIARDGVVVYGLSVDELSGPVGV